MYRCKISKWRRTISTMIQCVSEKRLPFEIKHLRRTFGFECFISLRSPFLCYFDRINPVNLQRKQKKSLCSRELRILGLIRELKQSNSNV